LQVGKCKALRVLDKSTYIQCKFIDIDFGDAAVVTNEVIFIRSEFCLNQPILERLLENGRKAGCVWQTNAWWFAIVGELKNMDHIFRFLLQYIVPADLRNVSETASLVILLKSLASKYGVGVWQWDHLILGWL
jgi:hypothetical protein